MLVELGLVEQRYQAVLEVLNDGATVTDVARRYGVARQTVHEWLRGTRPRGWEGWPIGARGRCRARIRWTRWSRRGSWRCAGRIRGGGRGRSCSGSSGRGSSPLPGRTSVERCLVRHGLVTPQARKRKRSDYKRWERSRAMELWQMDIVGGVRLVEGGEAKIVSGIDDHSRFVVSARAWWPGRRRGRCATRSRRPWLAMGCPRQILTDNGKVFTARFGPGPGPVLFDRICTDNGINHILTAPRSPTTTGKVERWHKTLRREFLDGKVFASIADAQAQLDVWVRSLQPRAAAPVDRADAARSSGSSSPTPRPGPAETARAELSRHRDAGDDAAGERQGHDQLRRRQLQGRGVAGRSRRRGRLRGRAGAAASPWCARRHPRPPPPPRQADRRAATRPPAPTARPKAVDRGVGDPQGRLLGQRVLRRHQLPGRHRSTGAARSKSPSSVTPSRSPSATSSSAATPSSTTAPASTAPSPTPAADPTASTPPEGSTCQPGTGVEVSGGYRGLTSTKTGGAGSVSLSRDDPLMAAGPVRERAVGIRRR